MENITIAGSADPLPVSEAAVELLNQRLTAARERDGDERADELEQRVGSRLAKHIADGMPSIDKATMRAVIDFHSDADDAADDEKPASGLGRVLKGLRKGR